MVTSIRSSLLAICGAFFLAGCGGGTLGAGSTTGGLTGTTGSTTGGTTGSGIPATLAIATSQSSITADGTSTTLVTATLKDTTSQGIANQVISFTTNAGSLVASSALTNAAGEASVFLRSGTTLGRATVNATHTATGLSASTFVTFTSAAATNLVISLAPNTVRPGGTSTVQVYVTDAFGHAVSGEQVTLSVPVNQSGGPINTIVVTTNESGIATTTYPAGSTPGTDVIQAQLPGSAAVTASLQVVQSAGQISSIDVTTSNSQAPADGTTTTQVSAVVTDDSGGPASGVNVNFSTSAGTLNPTNALTNASGIATTLLTSPSAVGTATVIASIAGFSDTTQVTFVAGSGRNIVLSLAKLNLAPGETTIARATVTDAHGNRVASEAVTFHSSSGGSFSPATVTTDSNGVAQSSYTAPLATPQPTSDALTATTASSGATFNTVTVAISPNNATVTSIAFAPQTTAVPGEQIDLTATLSVANGSPQGIPVTFTTTAGTVSPATSTADASGIARSKLTAPTNAGSITVTVSARGQTRTATITVTPRTATKVTVTVSPSTVAPNRSVSVQAKVTDANNNSLPNHAVTFSSTGSGLFQSGTGQGSNGTVTLDTLTDANGVAQAVFVPNGDSRTVTITAVAKPETPAVSGSATITVDPNAAVIGDLNLDTNPPGQTQFPADGAQRGVRATVTDTNGTAVEGVTVTFAGDNGLSGTATTNELGIADFTFNAPVSPGSVNITATAGAFSDTLTLTFTGNPVVTRVTLQASSPTLQSGATTSAQGVTLTAQVTDANNNPVSGVTVSFHSDRGPGSRCGTGGTIQPLGTPPGITNINGNATAILTTGGDRHNQVIRVTAQAGSAPPSTLDIQVTGTALAILGPSSLASNAVDTFQVSYVDSAGNGIPNEVVNLTSRSNNPLAPASVTTGANGTANFQYTATNGGNDLLQATTTNACDRASEIVAVSTRGLSFTQTPVRGEIVIGAPAQTIQVQLTAAAGVAVDGQGITFSTTRGTLDGGTLTTTSKTTAGGGFATVTLQQDTNDRRGVGGGILTATGPGGITADLSFAVVSHDKKTISLQASPTNPSVGGGVSTIKATVRDTFNNPVKDAIVDFTLTDNTGGRLSDATGTTDALGSVSITYTSSTAPSAKDGVVVRGRIRGLACTTTGACDTVNLTVGGQSFSITLGTGNNIAEENVITYRYPYSVQVTDAAGNPPPIGTTVSLQVDSYAYQKGTLVCPTGADFWQPDYSITTPQPDNLTPTAQDFGCANEDFNRNGIIDSVPGEEEDLTTSNPPGNHNGSLEPRAPVSVPASVALNADGFGFFDLHYPKDRANWVRVRLSASVTVSGSESVAHADFTLIGLDEDFACAVSPPGFISPYGVGNDCTDPN
jgi:adhesin/invasin